MRPFIKILAISVAVSTLTLSVYAFGGHERGAMGQQDQMERPPSPIRHLLREVGLSDEQMTALKELDVMFRAEQEEIVDDRSEKDQALADAISESGLDTSALAKSTQEQCIVRSEAHAAHLEQIIAILTPEQRSELKSLLEEKAANTTSTLEDLGY